MFIGFKKNPYPYIKQAKELVLTSDFEGLPTMILEAISLDVPVVTTDCPGGIRDIVDHNSPSLVPLANDRMLAATIDDVLKHPEKYLMPVQDKFDSQRVAEQYGALFN
ncbi:glycosyltransferase [Gammaproteobacteria bacterium]|nr:glycosyltransferase [Gammaproteobacteria bacterium]